MQYKIGEFMKKKFIYGVIICLVLGTIIMKYTFEPQTDADTIANEDIRNIYTIMSEQDSKIEFIANGFQKEFTASDKEKFLEAFRVIHWTAADAINFGEIPAERLRINDKYWLAFYDDKIEMQPSKKIFSMTKDEMHTLDKIIKVYRNDMFISDEVLHSEFFLSYFKEVDIRIEFDSEQYGYKKASIEQSNEFRELLTYDGWEQIFTYEDDLINIVNMREKGMEYISSITILEGQLIQIGREFCYFKIPKDQYDKILLYVDNLYMDGAE